jgi:hypothetical protein
VPQLRLLFAGVAGWQPDQAREQHPGEDRKAAEQGRGAIGQAPLARLVDRADDPREAHREGRQQRGDDRGGQEGIKRVELRWVRHRLLHSIAGREVESGAIYAVAPATRFS